MCHGPGKFLPTGNFPSNFHTSSFTLLYVGEVVISVRYSFKAPTFGSMPMQLSFRMMSISVSATPAWFIPSKARPAVMAPSPITATTFLSFSPLYFAAIAIPNAAEIEVEEWPTPNVSYSLSLRLGKPLRPLYFLLVGKIIPAAGKNFMAISLVAYIPNQLIIRSIVYIMQGQWSVLLRQGWHQNDRHIHSLHQ